MNDALRQLAAEKCECVEPRDWRCYPCQAQIRIDLGHWDKRCHVEPDFVEVVRLRAENAKLREALGIIPPDQFESLANWFDNIDGDLFVDTGIELSDAVQCDLRRVAKASREALDND